MMTVWERGESGTVKSVIEGVRKIGKVQSNMVLDGKDALQEQKNNRHQTREEV